MVCMCVCVLSSSAHKQMRALRTSTRNQTEQGSRRDAHHGVVCLLQGVVRLLQVLVLLLQVPLRLLQALAFLAGFFELQLESVEHYFVFRRSCLQRACPARDENAIMVHRVAIRRQNRPVINGGTCWALARSISIFFMCALLCCSNCACNERVERGWGESRTQNAVTWFSRVERTKQDWSNSILPWQLHFGPARRFLLEARDQEISVCRNAEDPLPEYLPESDRMQDILELALHGARRGRIQPLSLSQ